MKTEKFVVQVDIELKEIALMFIERRKAELQTMRESLESKNFQTLQTLGHQLKGNAGSYGFDELGVFGGQLETSAKKCNLTQSESAVNEIEAYLAHIEIDFQPIP